MNLLKTVVLLGILSGLLVAICFWAIGGTTGLIIGLGLAAITNLGSWFYSDKIALAAYRAQPVSYEQAPQLHNMIKRLCDRGNLPMPGVYIVPTAAPNAFATGRDPQNAAVAVTQGLLDILPEDELEGVIAHELTHIRNRDTLTQAVAATIGGAISAIAQFATYAMWFGGGSRDNGRGNPIGLLLTVMLAPISATVIQMAISRTREYAADAGAAKLTQNPRGLARALQRLDSRARQVPLRTNPAFEPLLIMNGFSGQKMANLFSTHPSTEARVQALLKIEQEMSNLPSI
ncbi:zinc metalloprotease HtpX [Capilliphycus salinus ALCB114379]|uniref:zinc metalloprotease HtpX n=1 Tax=Capilliphycus salinus TaxID=2768948 RepID=UPI0039A761EB